MGVYLFIVLGGEPIHIAHQHPITKLSPKPFLIQCFLKGFAKLHRLTLNLPFFYLNLPFGWDYRPELPGQDLFELIV